MNKSTMKNSLLFCGFAILSMVVYTNPKQSKPNVIMILADDLGYGDAGFNGCTDIPTPHIDRIATSGVRFTDAYSAGNVSAPSRHALLTGKYQTRFC